MTNETKVLIPDSDYFKFECGDEVKEELTGIVGIINRCTTYRSAQATYGVIREGLDKKGKPYEGNGFDESELTLVTKGKLKNMPASETFIFQVNDKLRLNSTGEEGLVHDMTVWRTGCRSVAIELGKVNKEEKIVTRRANEGEFTAVEVVPPKVAKAEVAKAKKGGPAPNLEKREDSFN